MYIYIYVIYMYIHTYIYIYIYIYIDILSSVRGCLYEDWDRRTSRNSNKQDQEIASFLYKFVVTFT